MSCATCVYSLSITSFGQNIFIYIILFISTPHSNPHAASILVHSLITSDIDYYNSFFFCLPRKILNKLQLAQTSAARISLPTTVPILQELPVKYRIDFKILLCVFKVIYDLAPPRLTSLLHISIPSSSLDLPLPSASVSSVRLTTMGGGHSVPLPPDSGIFPLPHIRNLDSHFTS